MFDHIPRSQKAGHWPRPVGSCAHISKYLSNHVRRKTRGREGWKGRGGGEERRRGEEIRREVIPIFLREPTATGVNGWEHTTSVLPIRLPLHSDGEVPVLKWEWLALNISEYYWIFIIYHLSFIIYCSLFLVSCFLFVVCCLLFVVCCLLFVVCCLLFVVCCLLFVDHIRSILNIEYLIIARRVLEGDPISSIRLMCYPCCMGIVNSNNNIHQLVPF